MSRESREGTKNLKENESNWGKTGIMIKPVSVRTNYVHDIKTVTLSFFSVRVKVAASTSSAGAAKGR